MTHNDIAIALNHPLTLGVILSRLIVAALPFGIIALFYCVHRFEKMRKAGRMRWQLDRSFFDQTGSKSWN